MHDPDEIARKIAEYREQIERLEQYIRQLLYLDVLNSEGNIVSYADLEA
ncbi:hypothetical protein H6S82_26055 [Planktothrix sp. FACHB-1355]|uniref:Uncharacterized protein n=1 Tax=Aerosakkonema funiforme FACHB-1375 TaxID=2949571 RepID=A0A926VHN9_9CYAN|nr:MULTISPECIES: hypothetical protein [Oscillatoriales]MBD2183915.1 hypothetical protein [Aerosakkonema funiforme FACHB-1375]MBD3562274.1 hypothetical protein [Planktothrix sp. FACHB-1355]